MNTQIGIDFGTSNSYCCWSSPTNLRPIAIPLDPDGANSTTTALLWANAEKPPGLRAFGNSAEGDWLMTPPEERNQLRFCTNFKPDIADSEEARANSQRFLQCIHDALADPQVMRGFGPIKDAHVAIGIPASPLENHETLTLTIASNAGFTNVSTVKEPTAALAYHLFTKDISWQQANRGVLVIDFGGGTCDVAYLVHGKVVETWGDPCYGGRLFDDLFYQWFLEQNPQAESRMQAAGDEGFIHWSRCRQAKEAFSRTMARDRSACFVFTDFLGYGVLKNATWAEFERRASGYRPSSGFQAVLNSFGFRDRALRAGQNVDLLARFQRLVGDACKLSAECTILTGGGSLWPFVGQFVIDELGMAPDRVHISGDPRGTIGQGIALVPLLRFQAESGKKDLKRARNTVQQEITAAIVQCCSSHFKEIAKAVATVFVVDELTPLVNELRGAVDLWSIGDVKAKLAARATAFGSVAIGLAKQREPQLKAQLQSVMQQHLGKWLLNHGIRWEPASNLGQVDVNDSIPQIVTPGSHRLLLGAAAAITTLVTMTVIANVCGGAGLALILTGPYGLVIGALIGLAMSVLVIVYGWQRAQESIESLTVPKVFRSMILPAGFADSMLPRLEAELVNKMNEQLAQQLPAISQDVDDAIRNVVDHLDWINSLSR